VRVTNIDMEEIARQDDLAMKPDVITSKMMKSDLATMVDDTEIGLGDGNTNSKKSSPDFVMDV
jgi:hypothetical protein